MNTLLMGNPWENNGPGFGTLDILCIFAIANLEWRDSSVG